MMRTTIMKELQENETFKDRTKEGPYFRPNPYFKMKLNFAVKKIEKRMRNGVDLVAAFNKRINRSVEVQNVENKVENTNHSTSQLNTLRSVMIAE